MFSVISQLVFHLIELLFMKAFEWIGSYRVNVKYSKPFALMKIQ